MQLQAIAIFCGLLLALGAASQNETCYSGSCTRSMTLLQTGKGKRGSQNARDEVEEKEEQNAAVEEEEEEEDEDEGAMDPIEEDGEEEEEEEEAFDAIEDFGAHSDGDVDKEGTDTIDDAGELGNSGKAGRLSCEAEEIVRREIVKVRKLRDPAMIRAVFHDAVDADNLLLKNMETGVWQPWPSDAGHYGGVDGCLYSPLSAGDKGIPEPSHNQNLGGNLAPLGGVCRKLCGWSMFKGTSLCANLADCPVDLAVFAAITAIRNAGGPVIPMTWGRKKGECTHMIVTPTKNSKRFDPKNYDKKPALRFAPSLTGIDDVEAFRNTFQTLGFNAEEQAALMGAHTFGKLAVCAGGLNGIEKGNFCRQPEKMDPPVTEAMYTSDSNPKGTCVPEVGNVSNCWKCWKGSSKHGAQKTFRISGGSGGCTPKFSHGAGKGFGEGFGDGGFWDRTPQTFDNDYFKLFENEEYTGKDSCCGSVKAGRCHRRNEPSRILRRDANGQVVKSKKIEGGICSMNWCRSDRKGKTHMKSTKTWHETSHDFVKKGYRHGVTKRMIRLAGDWALLGREDTRAAVQKFAASNDAFHEAFVKAFGKVINKGYEHDNFLTTCQP